MSLSTIQRREMPRLMPDYLAMKQRLKERNLEEPGYILCRQKD